MNNIKIDMPKAARLIISELENSGFKAYVVGGCVRDSLLGKFPFDWDITTSALPEQTVEIFKDYMVIPTGLKHGTVTIRIDEQNYEVTTFRAESGYNDSRHPESVEFVNDLSEDLKRRDFTVNALAYSEKEGLIDLYGGLDDLNNKIIRAVGDPSERFTEDALRILRGARFVSSLGFSIEDETLIAMKKHKGLLDKISAERVFVEMDKLLTGEFVKKSLLECSEIIFQVIPELGYTYNFLQHSKWHLYDVYTHTVVALSTIRSDSQLRWCMLLHDVGKPSTFFQDERGEGHFYGHPEISEEIARKVLRRLKAPTAFTRRVCLLIKHHDRRFPTDRAEFKRLLAELGEENVFALVEIKIADNEGQGTELALNASKKVIESKCFAEEIIASGECYRLKDLAVDGVTAHDCGLDGVDIGDALSSILERVIDGELPNDKEILTKELKRLSEDKSAKS